MKSVPILTKLGRIVLLGPRSPTKKEFSSANVWNTLYQFGQNRPFDKLEINWGLWVTLCMKWTVQPNQVEDVTDACRRKFFHCWVSMVKRNNPTKFLQNRNCFYVRLIFCKLQRSFFIITKKNHLSFSIFSFWMPFKNAAVSKEMF